MKSGSLIAIGKVAKAFGIRGEVIVHPLTDSVARFKRLNTIFAGPNEADARNMVVTAVAVDQRGVRMMFADVADRTSAEKLVGSLLFVDEKAAVRVAKGTFFIHDLIGINVVDEKGDVVGVLKDVLKYPAQDLYVIDSHGKDLLIPAVKEFVKKIDIGAKIMHVKVIDGMMVDEAMESDAD